jgi:purine-nucleoside phosphorylase
VSHEKGTLGIVAGSGIQLNNLLHVVKEEIAFDEVCGLKKTAVDGHAGLFLKGLCNGRPLVLQSGRHHGYEGLSFEEISRTVDIMYDYGVRTMLFTNAAGGLHPDFTPGALVAANCMKTWPCQRLRLPMELKPDFILPGCNAVGTQYWMHGPCYETQAEIKALQHLGAATVGMSTAPELLRCQQLGMRTAVVSCVTNSCLSSMTLTHSDVLHVAAQASEKLVALVQSFLFPE